MFAESETHPLTTVRFIPNAKLIDSLLNTKTAELTRWIGRDSDTEWIGYDEANSFRSADDAQSYLRTLQSNSIEPISDLRCFAALPFRTETWKHRNRWLLPKWTILHKQNQFEAILTGSRQFCLHDPNAMLLSDIASISQISHSRTTTAPAVTPMDQTTWRQCINTIQTWITAGKIRKMVLARFDEIPSPSDSDLSQIYSNMVAENSSSFRFQFPTEEGSFIGASPEQLCRVSNNLLSADALAGTRPRGNNGEEDRKFADLLFHSNKDRWEHEVVVDWLISSFRGLCSNVAPKPEPSIRKFATVQHLYSQIQGYLRSDTGLEQILAALHPTPAIGGDPRSIALDQISVLEKQDRGYYSGVVGWVSHEEAEFAVGIRSAMITGDQARIYAGVGIVDKSNPDNEWEETNWKMQTMKRAIQGNES